MKEDLLIAINILCVFSICLLFSSISLQVSLDNVEEYIESTSRFCLEKGIARQMEAFRAGFCRVFPLSKLRAFTPNEVRVMLCGDQNPHWTREDLLNYTEPKLGYTRDRSVLIAKYFTNNSDLLLYLYFYLFCGCCSF